MVLLDLSPEILAELAAIPDERPEVAAGPAPLVRDFLDEDQWFTAFDRWADTDKSLVDSLDSSVLGELTQAVSRINLTDELETAQVALNDSRWNLVALEHLDHTLSILATERDTIGEHLNRYLTRWVISSPMLIDQYALMNLTAKKTTADPYLVASMMTWYDWPRGLDYLLRVTALHTRTSTNLSRTRALCHDNRLPLFQNLAYPLHILPTSVSCEYGYEHYPTVNGFADFRAPSTSLEGSAAYLYMTHSISLRDTRRRTAMARLARGTAGVSDFLVPNHADLWVHGARAWLSYTIPKMQSACALKWAQVSSDLESYAEGWHAEAGYESDRVLVERYATYTLTRDRTVAFEYNNGDPVPDFVLRVISL